MPKIEVTEEYMRKKANADALLNLRDFLIYQDIGEEELQNESIIFAMLNATLRVPIDQGSLFNAHFHMRETVRTLTLGVLTESPLFDVNRGILLVALVELVLYPGRQTQIYKLMYNCDSKLAIQMYNELKGYNRYTLPGAVAAQRIKSFFHCDKFVEDAGCLERIRSYLGSIIWEYHYTDLIKDEAKRLLDTYDENPFENRAIRAVPDPMDF